jgi:hypothetical protein
MFRGIGIGGGGVRSLQRIEKTSRVKHWDDQLIPIQGVDSMLRLRLKKPIAPEMCIS